MGLFRSAGKLLRNWLPSSSLSVLFGQSQTGFSSTGLAIGGMQAASGVIVTEVTALQLTTFYACLRNISESIASMPFEAFELKEDGRRVRRFDHPLHQLLNVSPNGESCPIDVISSLLFGAAGWGNGYLEIQRNRAGKPVALWPIEPWKIRPMRRETGERELYYLYMGDTATRELLPEDVFHLKNVSIDGVNGLSPVRLAKNSLGLAIVLQEYGSKWFASGGAYKVTLIPPMGSTKEQIQSVLNGYAKGSEAGVGSLPPGWSSTVTSANPEEGQALESRQKQQLEICQLFRMPPSKVQDNSHSTYNNSEMENRAYLTDCLMGWARKIEQEARKKLCMSFEQSVFGEFNFDSLLRADPLTKARADQIYAAIGVYNSNEIRAGKGLNPYPGGEKYLVPANMTSMDALETMPRSALEITLAKLGKKSKQLPSGDPADPAAADVPPGGTIPGQPDDDPLNDDPLLARSIDGIKHAHGALLFDAIERLLRTEADKAQRASRKDGFAKWVDEFYTGHAKHVRSVLAPKIRMLCDSVLALRGNTSEGQAPLVDSLTDKLVSKHIAASRDDLQELAGLEQRISYWSDSRAQAFCDAEVDEIVNTLLGKK